VANDVTNDVAKIDPATGGIVAQVATGGTIPQEVAFDGSHIWVSNFSSKNVSKIDPESLVATTVATGINPQGVVFDGTNVWVVNSGGVSSSISRLLP
jgi:YVTN family beta-propeller protein